VPLGCCGSWLLILSLLPSVFGSSLSVLLIQYSKPLSYIGLAIVFGFAGLSAFKLQRELKKMEKGKMVKERSKVED
jgi:membrane protein DedA with SNARE-associated domain